MDAITKLWEPVAMVRDCRMCGEPYLADLARCPACGTDNPAYADNPDPGQMLSDKGLYGLAGLGISMAAVTGLILLFRGSHPAPPELTGAFFTFAIFGGASFVLLNKVEPTNLQGAGRVALRLFLALGYACVALAMAFLR